VSDTIFILGDADKIRERVEAALFAHDLQRLSVFSNSLTAAITMIVDRMERRLSATTVMAGGDDVLFTVARTTFDASVLVAISEAFEHETGCTMSFGAGISLEDAYLCLRKAKSGGGGAVKLGAGICRT
jgi:hypothetical protein